MQTIFSLTLRKKRDILLAQVRARQFCRMLGFPPLDQARVVAAGVSPLPAAGMHWRGRLSEISGWSFGHLGVEPPTTPAQDADHYL